MAHSSRSQGGGGDTDNLLRSHGNYEELAIIGTGAYGTVYKARDLSNDGVIVALKKVRVPLTDDGVPMSTLREIALLKHLDKYEHPNIVRLLDICHGQRLERERQLVLYLVFEHVEQDLASYLERVPPPGLPIERIKNLLKQILTGVDFLHTHRIVHRDLKPQNLLVSKDGVVKLADFGLAKTYDFEMRLTSLVVTLWYRAPEVLLSQPYASSVDIWSVGCIMAEMYRRHPLFSGSSEGDQLDKIFQIIGTPREADWPTNVSINWTSFQCRTGTPFRYILPEICTAGTNLLTQMLQFSPSERITAGNALNHDYFKEDEPTETS